MKMKIQHNKIYGMHQKQYSEGNLNLYYAYITKESS